MPNPSDDHALGRRALALVDELARFTDEPGRLTRLYLSSAHRAAAEATLRMMREAGMVAAIDAAGSVVGRIAGAYPAAPALLIGSHIDSVVDAGRFDGNLGVALGIVAVEALRADGDAPPFPIEVVAFGDEENVRFPTNLSTAHALAGGYDPAWLDARDADGVVLRDALAAFGGAADGIPGLARERRACRGYLEVHIEQGPRLEAAELPVGIVSAINGSARLRIEVTGESGHAGTVPMTMRRDALAAAAEMVSAIERIGGAREDTVATVGVARVQPGASNVIPARVDFSLDARAPDDPARDAMLGEIMAACESIAAGRGVALRVESAVTSPATPMDAALVETLEAAVAACGVRPMRLASGAGHDAVAMARLCPAAMLFVRCKGGVSHNPAESITEEDADTAARVLIAAVRRLQG